MGRAIKVLTLAALLLLTGGCGNWHTAFRKFSVDDRQSLMVDVKQRAVFIASREEAGAGGVPVAYPVICAEVSPDAMSAYAAELAAKAQTPTGLDIGLATATREGAAFVGNRTHTVQLLRDGMYRLCEAYLNKAISPAQFDFDMRRYQKYMVALMGIEQLTGVVRSPAASISTEGQASAALSLGDLRAEIGQVDKRIEEIGEQLAAAQDDDAKKELGQQLKREQETKADLEEALKSARQVATGGKAAAVLIESAQAARANAELQAEVVKAVADIMSRVIETDDTVNICLSIYQQNAWLAGSGEGGGIDGPAKSFCDNELKARSENRQAAMTMRHQLISTLAGKLLRLSPEMQQMLRLLIEQEMREGAGRGSGVVAKSIQPP